MTGRDRGRAGRLAQYAALRDQGTRMYDAARDLGIATGTAQAYERWYRAQRGLPARDKGAGLRQIRSPGPAGMGWPT
jgi:hypothetical protein